MNAPSSSRSSWTVHDERVHDDLVTLMNLTDADLTQLTALTDVAEAVAPEMAEAFYDRLLAHPHTADYFAEGEMDARHDTIQAWFLDLFRGTYDDAYVRDRLQIGRVHVQIGLPVRYPLAMLDVVTDFGERVTAEAADPDAARRAFHKVLALDVAVFNQAYEDNQLQHLADLVGGEHLARRLLMGEA